MEFIVADPAQACMMPLAVHSAHEIPNSNKIFNNEFSLRNGTQSNTQKHMHSFQKDRIKETLLTQKIDHACKFKDNTKSNAFKFERLCSRKI